MATQITTAQLQALANTLLQQDEDKVITKEELKNFVASNDEQLTAMNVSADDAMKEIENILKDNMEKTDGADNTQNNDNQNNTDNNDPVAQYNNLQAKVEEYKKQLAQYDIQIDTLTKDTEALQKQLDTAIKEYNSKEAELISQNKHLEEVMNDINSSKEQMASDVENQQKRAVWNAINDYDPEKDGDWDSYLQKACEGSVYSPLASKISSLVSNSQVTVNSLKSMAASLSSLGQNVETLSDKITKNTTEIGNLNKLKATTQTALEKTQKEMENCILNLVSCEEMNLVKANNIDLKEKLPDGSPRYIFAKGKEDGKFHIYDMGNGSANGAGGGRGSSLARLYGCDNTGGLKGSDIVPMGNGYITINSQGDSAPNGDEIFWLSDCGMQKDKACYCTSSPLEFDLDGNGHKNDTSKTTKFDIDGDGKLDNINDSLDGVLVFDKDGDGISGEDGSEMFGDNTDLDNKDGKDGYKNGFEALKALRDKAIKEGVIQDRGDNKLNADDLAALEKNYGLKMKTDGYNSDAKSLSDVGITEINLSDSKVSDKQQFDSFGNEVQTQEGATFKINGQENSYVDMWHRKYTDDEVANYDSIKNSNLSFNLDEAAKYATNAKLNVSSKMANILTQTNANENNAQTVSAKAKKDANAMLNEKFWKGTQEPNNFFMKKNDETEKAQEEELEAKKQEEKEVQEQELKEEEKKKELD